MFAVLRRLYLLLAYYLSWLWFGVGGLTLNLVCAVLLLAPRRERFAPAVRSAIRWLFVWWVKWFHATGVVEVVYIGFPDTPLPSGTIYIANHPSLVDAPMLLAVLTDAICIFKPALLRNPCIAPAAILAGYSSGDAGIDLIRDVAEKVASGRSLLIFPEGTRTTPGTRLNTLKPGFAIIAQRAGAPIRLITISAPPLLTSRGVAWWKPPPLPGRFEIRLQEVLHPEPGTPAAEITQGVQERLASLVGVVPSSLGSCHDQRVTSC